MTSLVSQAAVALVENKGDLSKTLKALGSSSSVKSLATSMAIGGVLAGFDEVVNVSVTPDKARCQTLDHAGNIRSVAPKPVTNDNNHHIFDADGNFQGRR